MKNRATTDPRVKLLIIVALSTVAVLAQDVVYLAIVFAFALIAVLSFKIDMIKLILRLKMLFGIILFIAFVQSVFAGGETPLVKIDDFVLVSLEGIIMAVEFLLRMTIIIFAGALSLSTDGHEMLDGMQKMKVPYEILFMASIALRFLPLFRDEFQSRLSAIALRAIDLKGLGIVKKLKIYAYLITPTIAGAMLKSSDLSRAMESRGLRAYKHRTMVRQLKMQWYDWIISFIVVVLLATFLTLMYICGRII